jgi:trk system potassium uptake protein TrkA
MKVLIVGAGKLGRKLSTSILNSDIDITVIDSNPIVINRLKEHLDVLTINANGVRKEILEDIEIDSYDISIAVTGQDEINMIISSICKRMGCKKTIARVRQPEYVSQIEFLKDLYQIDHIVNPELSTAFEIMHYILDSYGFSLGNYGQGRLSILGFDASHLPHFINKKIRDVKQIDDCIIIGLSRKGETLIPNGDTIIRDKDKLLVLTEKANIKPVATKLRLHLDHRIVRKVMILGGGKTAFYLARELSKRGLQIKLIESDLLRCRELAEKLDSNTLVIHGQGTDGDLLEEEGLENMDAFVCVTGYDEENLFMSIKAKQLNIPKVITKISRQSYGPIVEQIGVNMAINPVNVSASEIMKYVRGGQVLSVNLMMDGQAELTEIIARDNLKILNIPLKKLNLPRGFIIAAIIHNSVITIPSGDSMIQAGDIVVVFARLSALPELEIFFKLKGE